MTMVTNRPRWEMGWLPVHSHLQELNRGPEDQRDGRSEIGTAPSAFYGAVFHGGVWEDEQHVYYEFDMPGLSHETLDLSIEKGVLSVRGERQMPGNHGKCWLDERYYGRFERTIKLPGMLDLDSIDASYLDGVLRLEIAKRPESMPTKIAIRRGGTPLNSEK